MAEDMRSDKDVELGDSVAQHQAALMAAAAAETFLDEQTDTVIGDPGEAMLVKEPR
jgi:hypothetical protein